MNEIEQMADEIAQEILDIGDDIEGGHPDRVARIYSFYLQVSVKLSNQ